jgi:hypothetical protein
VEEELRRLLGFGVLREFGCISVVAEGACVRGCRGLGLCTAGTVGQSASSECVERRGHVVIGRG